MPNRKSSAYWDARESAEQAWMKEQLAKDERFNKELDRAYQVAIDNINKEIQANIDKIGGVQNLVTASQMAEYERLAKQAVDHANELMKAGHKVTKKDFSPEVNARLKVYNATMRVNQLELMKSKIAVHNLNLGMDIQAKIADKLYDDYIKEMERQAGILGLSAKNASLWTDREVMNLISAQSANGVFSQRIWANTDVLKAKLDGILATGIIRGSNPREMARYLRDQVSDTFKNAVYASERLARTESARVQHKAQVKSLKDNGYDFCKWHLEPGACKICIGIREDATKYGLGVYRTEDVPDIPVHPNCRCAISAYWVDEDKYAEWKLDKGLLTDDNHPLTSEKMEKIIGLDKVAALKQYMSAESYLLNDCLRNDVKLSDGQQKLVNNLDEALAKLPKYRSDKPVSRDFSQSMSMYDIEDAKEIVKSWKEQGYYQDKAYISTSKGHYAEGEELIHMIIKKHHSGVDLSHIDESLGVNDKESEVLFARNTKFKILKTGYDKIKDKILVYVEEAND